MLEGALRYVRKTASRFNWNYLDYIVEAEAHYGGLVELITWKLSRIDQEASSASTAVALPDPGPNSLNE